MTLDLFWATDVGAVIAEPSNEKKEIGFLHDEKPPAEWFNFLFNKMSYIKEGSFVSNIVNDVNATPLDFTFRYFVNQRIATIFWDTALSIPANTVTNDSGFITFKDKPTVDAMPDFLHPEDDRSIPIVVYQPAVSTPPAIGRVVMLIANSTYQFRFEPFIYDTVFDKTKDVVVPTGCFVYPLL
jgi:hypothetical protein